MRKKIVSKKEIVTAVLCVIEKKGLQQCSVREMASELNIAVGTLYNYFGSREDMIIEAFNYSWKETMAKCQDIALSKDSQLDKILTLFQLVLEDVMKRKNLGQAVFLLLKSKDNVHFATVKANATALILSIVADKEDKEALAKWLTVMLFDVVHNKNPLSDGDIRIIKKLIE